MDHVRAAADHEGAEEAETHGAHAQAPVDAVEDRDHVRVVGVDGEYAVEHVEGARAVVLGEQLAAAPHEVIDEPALERLLVRRGCGEVATELRGDLVGRDAALLEVGLDREHHLADGLEPIHGLRRHRAHDDPAEPVADPRVRRARIDVLAVGDLLQHLVRVLALEREPPDAQLIKHDAEREHVGAEVELPAFDVLGRHVRRRAEQLARHGQPLEVDHVRDAEVHQLHHSVGADHDVLRLHVAVEDAVGVRVREGAADLQDDHRPDLGERDRPVGDHLLEGLTVDELGDDVRLGVRLRGVVEDLEDVLVAKLRHRLRLALEPVARFLVIGEVFVQHLHGDHALQRAIDAAIDNGHPALPDSIEQLVLVEDLADLDHRGAR